MITALLIVLALGTGVFAVFLFGIARRGGHWPRREAVAVGAVANFFDALGVGSFAPSTAYLRFRRLVPDELIPPTMIAGYTLPTMVEALAYTGSVAVDPVLLVGGLAVSALGSLVGVRVASRLPVQAIRLTMGVGLLLAAGLYSVAILGLTPGGGSATGLAPAMLVAALAALFVFGVLIHLGIGNFAPTLVLFGLLGLDPRAAFPVMMGGAAFILLAGAFGVLRQRPVSVSMVVGMAIGGVPGVLVAAYIVKSLPLGVLQWGVVAIVVYAGATMLAAARSQPVPQSL